MYICPGWYDTLEHHDETIERIWIIGESIIVHKKCKQYEYNNLETEIGTMVYATHVDRHT